MEISLANLLGALLMIGARISGLMLFVPFFGHGAVPVRIKAALVVAITAVLYPVVSVRIHAVAPSSWPWLLGSELLLGAAMGIATNLVFEGVQVAGHVMSIQMGYSLVNILDPQTQVDTTVVSVFTEMIALLIFLALDVHHWILRIVAQSFETLVPGQANFGAAFTTTVIHAVATILPIGIQIAAPVLTATIAADLLLGLLSKAAPQMPILFLGPAVKAMLSVLLLAAALPYWPHVFAGLFQKTTALTEQILQVAR
jgi:flagellar biosynthetic protein FliR